MAIKNRYDFMILFEVTNGNPNGDFDANNIPRVDIETGHGYVTDVCLKRKIRNYVELLKFDDPKNYQILIKPDKCLNDKFAEAFENLNIKKNKKKDKNDIQKAKEFVCENYYDARTFGAILTGANDRPGIIRGPVQINFAKSVSPVNVQEITITRQARTTKEAEKTGETEVGKKAFVPYALYCATGHISAMSAEKTGFDDEDLEILWKSIINMFEEDHSATRGEMSVRKLYVFKHEHPLGNCQAYKLFDKIKITTSVDAPRKFNDYDIEIEKIGIEGVELTEKVENKTLGD